MFNCGRARRSGGLSSLSGLGLFIALCVSGTMGASQYRDRAYEYRLMSATAASLACCAVSLAAAQKRDVSSTGLPETSQAPDTTSGKADPALKSASAGSECPGQNWPYFSFDCLFAEHRAKRRSLRLKGPWCTGVLSHQPFHSCSPRPKWIDGSSRGGHQDDHPAKRQSSSTSSDKRSPLWEWRPLT